MNKGVLSLQAQVVSLKVRPGTVLLQPDSHHHYHHRHHVHHRHHHNRHHLQCSAQDHHRSPTCADKGWLTALVTGMQRKITLADQKVIELKRKEENQNMLRERLEYSIKNLSSNVPFPRPGRPSP